MDPLAGLGVFAGLLRPAACAVAASLLAGLILWTSADRAAAICDVIPGVTMGFRGALGSLNRPFAIPGDDGEELTIRLDPLGCEAGSLGFADLPGGTVPEDDYFVTVVFEPPQGGPRNAVVLATATNRAACEARLPAPESLPGGGSATCSAPPTLDQCVGGAAAGSPCTGDPECPDGTCLASPGRADFSIARNCVFGPKARERCTEATHCPEGTCVPTLLRFRFPDTDTLLSGPGDDHTLTGPATIAVTATSDPLPLGLASSRCADTPGLAACIDELYAADGTCETGGDAVDPTFGHFTALPPANDYQALCTTAEAGSPCQPRPPEERELRFTVDAAGNVLAPMEYRGVLVVNDRIPIPRLVLGNAAVEAFSGRGTRVQVPSDRFIASFAPGGQRLPPIFTPVHDPTSGDRLSLFGSVDAPVGVIRVQRTGCVGGAEEGKTCTTDAECGEGASCRTLFDFSDRLTNGAGPVLIAGDDFDLQTQNPVPLDGLIESESMFAFVSSEAIDGKKLNDDSDATDPVLQLRARETGGILSIGTNGAEGRAVTRVKDGRFRFPAVAVENNLVAFLELEPLEGDCLVLSDGRSVCDKNRNGSVFEPILRVYRLTQDGSGATRAEELQFSPSLPHPIVVDAAPLVNGRSVAISDGLLYFRTPEWLNAQQVTELVSVDSSGTHLHNDNPIASLSADGSVVAFTALVASEYALFVHDRTTREIEEVRSTPLYDWTLSADGSIMFLSRASDLAQPASGGYVDIFARDRAGGETRKGSFWMEVLGHLCCSRFSADGSVVAFASGDPPWIFPGHRDLFVHDTRTGETEKLHSTEWGYTKLSADGSVVAFESSLEDHSLPLSVSIRDRVIGKTHTISSGDWRYTSLHSLSADGRLALISFDSIPLGRGLTGWSDLRVYDHSTRTFADPVCVSSDGRRADGRQARGGCSGEFAADDRFVLLSSGSPDLVPGDTGREYSQHPPVSCCGGSVDAFLHDRITGATQRVSVATDGSQKDTSQTEVQALSADGRVVLFASTAGNLALK